MVLEQLDVHKQNDEIYTLYKINSKWVPAVKAQEKRKVKSVGGVDSCWDDKGLRRAPNTIRTKDAHQQNFWNLPKDKNHLGWPLKIIFLNISNSGS